MEVKHTESLRSKMTGARRRIHPAKLWTYLMSLLAISVNIVGAEAVGNVQGTGDIEIKVVDPGRFC